MGSRHLSLCKVYTMKYDQIFVLLCFCCDYTPAQRSCWWVYWCHSIRPSVRPSIHPTSCVPSVVPTVQDGSISYSYILSSNFRRSVACNVACKILKCKFLAIFLNLYLWLCLLLTLDLMWITSMGNDDAVGCIAECRHSSCSSSILERLCIFSDILHYCFIGIKINHCLA